MNDHMPVCTKSKDGPAPTSVTAMAQPSTSMICVSNGQTSICRVEAEIPALRGGRARYRAYQPLRETGWILTGCKTVYRSEDMTM
jgi:hypothetical protein